MQHKRSPPQWWFLYIGAGTWVRPTAVPALPQTETDGFLAGVQLLRCPPSWWPLVGSRWPCQVELFPVAVLFGLSGGIKPPRAALRFGWAPVTASIICRRQTCYACTATGSFPALPLAGLPFNCSSVTQNGPSGNPVVVKCACVGSYFRIS